MAAIYRTNSICPDPKTLLLEYVKKNNIEEIKNIIQENEHLLNEKYGHPYNKPILYIACYHEAKSVNSNTIDALINLGCDLHYTDMSYQGNEALHFAALGLNPDILKCIIKHSDNINVENSNGNTALNILIKDGDSKNENFINSAKILINSVIDINKTDNKNAPPIFWAIRKKYDQIINLLLQHNDINIDIKVQNKIIRNLLQEQGYEVDNIKNNSFNNNINLEGILWKHLKENNPDQFIYKARNIFTEGDVDYQQFFQFSIERNFINVVDFLLEKGVNPNETSLKNKFIPIAIAASRGYYQIFKKLIEHPSIIIDNCVLHEILRKFDYEGSSSDYSKCYETLIESKFWKNGELDVNGVDEAGNYPLHYGARYGGPEVASDLLKCKASLGNKNKNNLLTISDVDFETLKEHFDNCIEAKPVDKLDKENMTIIFDYETLLPSKINIVSNNDEEKHLNDGKHQILTPEAEVVLFISKSAELKPLLKHPLLTSFLYVKWHKIRWIFYTNLIFYLIFCLSLLLYVLIFYNFNNSIFCSTFLFLTTGILIARELFQLFVSPKKYIFNFENYLEIALIITVLLMLFLNSPSQKVRTQLCAIAFLLVAFELLFLLGNHPNFTTNIVMLRTVSKNFFKFFLFYSILILAFAFCFHTLFHNSEDHEFSKVDSISNKSSIDENENENSFFVNPFMSMFKTIIMLTGEFEAGEIQFEKYPITSHLIFIAFVVTIAVILLNLLNGLAVSDTQEIKNEAELVGHVARAEYISYAESMIFNKLLPRMNLFTCTDIPKNETKPNNSFFRKHVSLCSDYLKGKTLVVYPNQNGMVDFPDHATGPCKKLYLDKKSIREARFLLHKKIEGIKKLEQKKKDDQILIDKIDKLYELLKKDGKY